MASIMSMCRAVAAGVLFVATSSASFAVDRLVPSQYSTIQAAINAAVAGDRVLVSQGTYVETISLGGKAITLQSVSGAAVTVLTPGSVAGAVVTCASNETASCVIDGFTITGATNGPGIRISTASPTVRNCVISQNVHSSNNGGGVWIAGSSASPKFTDCFFIGNRASGTNGGAIAATASAGLLTCVGCTFRLNETDSTAGGAVYAIGAPTEFEDCDFDRNAIARTHGDNRGGAIYTTTACTLTDCEFVENSILTNGDGNTNCFDMWARGGAIWTTAAITAVRVDFTLNLAQCDRKLNCGAGWARGGAVAIETGSLAKFTDCTFSGNRAMNPLASCTGNRDARGGACHVAGGSDPVFENCDFFGNRAESCSTAGQYGGTIFYEGGSEGQVVDCTVSGSYAGLEGGGFYIAPGAGPNIQRTTFSNCATGTSGSGGAIFIAPSSVLTFATDCRFTNCTAGTGGGGAVWVNNARPRFDRCTFDHNTAASGSALRSLGTGSLNIPTVCYSNFCSNSGASTNWILGAFADPHPTTPSNSFNASCGSDCDSDGVPNSVEISTGSSTDCDANGVPDDCEPDCDGDGLPNACELASGAVDCNEDSIPDSCQQLSQSDLNRNGILDGCERLDFIGLETEVAAVPSGIPGMPSTAVQWRVYATFSDDNALVSSIWGDAADPLVIDAVGGFFQVAPSGAKQNEGGGDLSSQIDCDAADPAVAFDSFLSINRDCPNNPALTAFGTFDFSGFNSGGGISVTDGAIVADAVSAPSLYAGSDRRVLLMQLTTNLAVKPTGTLNLIGDNGVAGADNEWYAFGIAIPDPTLVDCNGNGVHDILDIASGAQSDCDANGVPDDCQSDCDDDGVLDICEFAGGSASDVNNSGVPDNCECIGDANSDGVVNVEDLLDVIAAWGDPNPGPADLDNDGDVDGGDLAMLLQSWGSCL